MFRFLILPLIIFTYSCSNESGAKMGLFTATAPVLAILQDDLFSGSTTGYPDRTGDINVTSPTGLPQFKDLTGKNLAKDFWNGLGLK